MARDGRGMGEAAGGETAGKIYVQIFTLHCLHRVRSVVLAVTRIIMLGNERMKGRGRQMGRKGGKKRRGEEGEGRK